SDIVYEWILRSPPAGGSLRMTIIVSRRVNSYDEEYLQFINIRAVKEVLSYIRIKYLTILLIVHFTTEDW
ncbi:hypothetical protein CO051_02465, partial [Candidatus Roizmanbacteria bacterium CG_4_9_14_0_2_um_filter_39_13]